MIGRRRARAHRLQLQLAEWQTRTVALFIAQSTPVDLDKHGGRNPLVDAAMQLTLLPDEEDELAEMRGEQTGYVTDEEGRKLMAAKGKTARRKPRRGVPTTHAPLQDTLQVDEDNNVIGVGLGVDPEGFTEREFGEQATPGSFEAFMRMFGGGGAPGPR